MNNKGKIDQLHDIMPNHLNTRTNPNWKALLDAIGSQDQNTADLVAQVRQQFFVKTASAPYLDRLAANNLISRPAVVGMDDPAFRKFIPILSYQPKQVKLIIDQLLDIFFFKESTTAFVTSQMAQPFALQDGWYLEYLVDELNDERIQFNADEFTNIASASADEVVAAINRQTVYSYATADYDSITKNTYIQIFTNTIGSKGSIRMVGGGANVALQFNGFNTLAGNGPDTQWTVTKVGQNVTLTYVGGSNPGINQLQIGDVAIINLPGNVGSFPITNINLANQSITFINLFGTPGTYTQTDVTQTKFFRPNKYVAYLNPQRAMTWETVPGEIIVEMPTSPPVVKRSLIGSAHINGTFSQMLSLDSDTSLTLQNATDFPTSGNFWLQSVEAITSHILTPTEDTVVTSTMNTRLSYGMIKYSYTGRSTVSTTGNIVADVNQITVVDPTGIIKGQQVVMTGVPGYALVTAVAGNIVTIDHNPTVTTIDEAVSFLGNQLTGISPNLPSLSTTNELTNISVVRTGGNLVTVTTSAPHGFNINDSVIISGNSGIASTTTTGNTVNGSNQVSGIANMTAVADGMIISGAGIPAGATVTGISGNTITMSVNASASNTGTVITFGENLNGSFIITSVTSTTYTFALLGLNGSVTAAEGTSRTETIGLASSGSIVFLTDAVSSDITRIKGPYMWDPSAPFVLSSDIGTIADAIQAGKIVRLLNLGTNTIPATGGSLIFDYGLNTQEGPVRFLYKPSDSTIVIDPSYTFKFSHTIGSGITLVESNGPHIMSGLGTEYPAYITDPSQARIILENLITSVKSAGIFIDFLIHYPNQLYGMLDVYDEQGLGAGVPFK